MPLPLPGRGLGLYLSHDWEKWGCHMDNNGRSCVSSQLGPASAWSFSNTPFPPLKARFQWFLCGTPGTSVCRKESEGCPPSACPKGTLSTNTQGGHSCAMSLFVKYHYFWNMGVVHYYCLNMVSVSILAQ